MIFDLHTPHDRGERPPTRPTASALRAIGRALPAAAMASAMLAACGSVPVASLWKLRKLNLETLDPAALRAAVVHRPGLQLHGQELVLTVSVSRKLRQPNGSTVTEQLEEKLPCRNCAARPNAACWQRTTAPDHNADLARRPRRPAPAAGPARQGAGLEGNG